MESEEISPEIYSIDFLLPGIWDRDLETYSKSLFNKYFDFIYNLRLGAIPPTNLIRFLNTLESSYTSFYQSIKSIRGPEVGIVIDPRDDFVSLDIFNERIDEIKHNSREGDLINISDRSLFYISGFGISRKIIRILSHEFKPSVGVKIILPPEALAGIKGYGIHELKDLERLYPNVTLNAINIPRVYLEDHLSNDMREAIVLINNRKSIYPNLPVVKIDLNRGDYLYISPMPHLISIGIWK